MTDASLSNGQGCPSGLSVRSAQTTADVSAFVRDHGQEKVLTLTLDGAKCGGCLHKIEAAVAGLKGVSNVRMNLSTGRLDVRWNGPLNGNLIAETVRHLGYGVTAHTESESEHVYKREERKLLLAMGVAGFAAANIMLLSVSVWAGGADMNAGTRQALHTLSGFIALPAVAFSGQHFFRSAWSVLRHGHANMDVPISLAVSLAFGVSVWATLRDTGHAYFDASVMLLFFLLIGRFLDARLRRRAYSAAHDLAALQGTSVLRIDSDGVARLVRAQDVVAGDQIVLSPGERAPIDMIIREGSCEVDECLVTGETLPRLATVGMTLHAGTLNLSKAVTAEALGPAGDSLLADIAKLMELGEQRRSTYRRISDRAVQIYIPFVHSAAVVAFVGWLLAGSSVEHAIMIAAATLIITCPCALALAAPIAQVIASGKLFRDGVFLKSGDALERFAEIDYVVLDKTGTLTLGTPALLNKGQIDPGTLMEAASLARTSRHPLSRALVEAAGPGRVAQDVTEETGRGLSAKSEAGVDVRLGSADWTGARDMADAGLALWFAKGDLPPVRLDFADLPHEGTVEAVADLTRLGMDVDILSGDRQAAVAKFAATVGITSWKASASPRDKAAHLEALKDAGRRVLMVGDGLNDAAALSLAYASLAPGGAIGISQSASDAVYGSGPAAIPMILQVARKAQSVVRQNFAFAAIYNLVAVPVAISGHVTPLIAAIAMSASSILVTLNALRIGVGGRSK